MTSPLRQTAVAASRLLDRASLRLAQATLALCFLLSVGFVFCILLQILFRYALNAPLTWTGELAVFQFLWMVMLLASVGVRENFHIRLTVLSGALPAPLKRGLDFVTTAVICAFGVVMVVAGARFVELTWGDTSAAISYPLQSLYMAAPVSGALIAVHALARLIAGPADVPAEGQGLPNVNGGSRA